MLVSWCLKQTRQLVGWLLGFNVALTSEVISRRCLLVAVVLWPMCCHTGMPCRRHRTWHPTPSQYTDTGPTCRCAIHWCGTLHWKPQLPILMSWVWPDREILPRPSTHEANVQLLLLSWWQSVWSSVESVPYPPGLEPGTCGVRIHYAIRSATAASVWTDVRHYTFFLFFY